MSIRESVQLLLASFLGAALALVCAPYLPGIFTDADRAIVEAGAANHQAPQETNMRDGDTRVVAWAPTVQDITLIAERIGLALADHPRPAATKAAAAAERLPTLPSDLPPGAEQASQAQPFAAGLDLLATAQATGTWGAADRDALTRHLAALSQAQQEVLLSQLYQSLNNGEISVEPGVRSF
ncbi:MAG: hypothetical protein AAGI15_05105 [Pseudomonadota bacterium]